MSSPAADPPVPIAPVPPSAAGKGDDAGMAVTDSSGAGRGGVRGPEVLALEMPGLALGGTPILGPLALRVAAGETVVITGPSGIGKSTLLRVILGLLPHEGGRLAVHGRAAAVFQEPTLLPWRSARANLEVTAGVDRPAAEAALAEVGLAGKGALFPGQLSLGQQRRLALARAFAVRPALLVMDEPFVSLDPALACEMMTLFDRLRAESGAATLLVTHVEAEARRLGSRLVRLGGRPARIVEDRPL